MITPQVVTTPRKALTQDQINLLQYIREMTVELGDLAEAGGLPSVSRSLRDIAQSAQSKA